MPETRGADTRPGHALRWSLLGVFVLGTIARAPELWLHPRFWGEEANVYFQAALDRPWWDALTAGHLGYYSLWSNSGGVLASWVPLAHAPAMTLLLALVAQLLAPLVVLGSRAPVWRTHQAKALALAILLFAPASGETWLTSIASHFHFALAASLLLLEPPGAHPPSQKWFHRGILLLGGLTGVITCLLTPCFVLRAAVRVRNRQGGAGWREPCVQGAILTVTSALQLAAVTSGSSAHGGAASRLSNFSPEGLGAIAALRTVVEPVAGPTITGELAGPLYREATAAGAGSMSVPLLVASVLGLGLVALCWWGLVRRRPTLAWLLGAYTTLLVPSILSAGGSRISPQRLELLLPLGIERYVFVPATLMLLATAGALALSWQQPRASMAEENGAAQHPAWRIATAAVLVVALMQGALAWRGSLVHTSGPGTPRWSDEIQRWESDPGYAPRAWPASFRVRIPAARHPQRGSGIAPAPNR